MEIDLHELTVNDAIRIFIEKYNLIYKGGHRSKVEVIHGYGSSGKGGKIKKAFKKFCEEHKKYLKVEYTSNPGITIVYPKEKLPEPLNILSLSILEFCKGSPKSLSKIESNFFKSHQAQEIKSSVKSLVKKGKLEEIIKKREIVYLKKE